MLDSRRNIALACALSMLAGYVDGIGFLHLGGLFVSFMSGNSTRLGVSLAEAQWWQAASALGLIALFVAGAAAGSLVVLGGGAERQPWLLLIETGLLRGPDLAMPTACRTSRSRQSSSRWAWRTPCSRSTAARASASPMSRARWSRSASSSR
ncbi:membrane protein [Bradyrhizobium japonicum]|uniref:Membrane protein n=1 Tax=Bradyrhizobium japonicum TaxID=375 RepID=A0A1L3F574_BRAJP|nr:membrane protein [Bradyrhizobium japonicum]